MLPIEIRYGNAPSDAVPERHERQGSGGAQQLAAAAAAGPISPRLPPPSPTAVPRSTRDSVGSPVKQRNELRGSGIRDSGSMDKPASTISAEGYLKKKGEQNPIWKRRFFLLKDHILYYYEDQRKMKLLGQINLHDALLIRTSPPSSHLAQALSIWSPNRYFQIDCPLRTYYFYAETLDDVRNWLRVLSDSKVALKRRERNAARASAALTVPNLTQSPVPQLPSLSTSTPLSISVPASTILPIFPSVPNTAPQIFSSNPRNAVSTSALPDVNSRRASIEAAAATKQSNGNFSGGYASVDEVMAIVIDPKHASIEAAAASKQANVAGGYAGVDDAMAGFAQSPAASSSVRRRSGSFIDPNVDETPLSHLPLHATQSQRALMPEEGCEIDMQQIKFMEERGEGAFGKVFHCLLWEKDVAVKVLKDQGLQRVKADLENEIAVLKSLRHPNCVLFIGYSVTPFFYIITEYMSQGSLYDILHNPIIRLTSTQQVKITIEIALAMNYLHPILKLINYKNESCNLFTVMYRFQPLRVTQQHNPQVLHRDLKTSNVLINESWTVKVSDFGLAELRGALQLPQVCGAVQWRAPEVTETFFHAPADVFSFGILCWEIMTRKKPFGEMEPMDVLRAIQEGKRPPLSELDAGLQADIIQRCWAHDPFNRPSFQQILESLKPLAIEEDLQVMQLKSISDIYLLSEPNCVQKFQRRTQQGLYDENLCTKRTNLPSYPLLPPHSSHARIWSTMFRHGKTAEGLKIFTESFYPALEGLAKGALIMYNQYGKMKAVFYYDTQEHVKRIDQTVGRLDTPIIEGIFSSLREVVCAPLIRENLEVTEFSIGNMGEITAAQFISSSLTHNEQKPAAFTSFDNFIDNTFSSMKPRWQGSLMIGDHSTYAFTIVNLFQSKEDIDAIETSGVVQQKIEGFSPVLASIPIIENYSVHYHRRTHHSGHLSGSHSPLHVSSDVSASTSILRSSNEASPSPPAALFKDST